MKMHLEFTNESLAALPFKYRNIVDPEFEGLNFLVNNRDAKWWWLFYSHDDCFYGESLGSFEAMSIDNARQKAFKLLEDIKSGEVKNYLFRFCVCVKISEKSNISCDPALKQSNALLQENLTAAFTGTIVRMNRQMMHRVRTANAYAQRHKHVTLLH